MNDNFGREITTEDSKTYTADGVSITLPDLEEGQLPISDRQIVERFNAMAQTGPIDRTPRLHHL